MTSYIIVKEKDLEIKGWTTDKGVTTVYLNQSVYVQVLITRAPSDGGKIDLHK